MLSGKRIEIGPVIIGTVVDIGGTLVTSVILFSLAGAYMVSQGITEEAEITALLHSGRWLVFWFAMGSFFTYLGGFVTGVRVTKDPVRHAFIMGCASLVLGGMLELAFSGQEQTMPLWVTVATYATIVPVACFGGWMGGRSSAK